MNLKDDSLSFSIPYNSLTCNNPAEAVDQDAEIATEQAKEQYLLENCLQARKKLSLFFFRFSLFLLFGNVLLKVVSILFNLVLMDWLGGLVPVFILMSSYYFSRSNSSIWIAHLVVSLFMIRLSLLIKTFGISMFFACMAVPCFRSLIMISGLRGIRSFIFFQFFV